MTYAFVRSAFTCLVAAIALTAPGASLAQQALKFSLDWRIEGPAAPFLFALDKGYFKSEGLDVTIDTAQGSLEPISRIASGAYDLAFGDINALIKYRDQNPGAPVVAVYMVYNKPAYAIIGRKSRGVLKPADLAGRRLGAPLADASYAQWPLFAQMAGIDAAKVLVTHVGFPVREPMLASGEVDAITGFPFSSAVDLKDRGVPADDISVLAMADYGVKLYGNAIVANAKFAAEKPEAVRGFLRAFARSLQDTIKRPAVALESVIRRNEYAKKDVELERLLIALRMNVQTAETKANGLGTVDSERLSQSIEQIGGVYTFKNAKPKPQDVFDPSFLPAQPVRPVN